MKIHCINCDRELEVSDADAGHQVHCNACGKDFTLPPYSKERGTFDWSQMKTDASAESFDPKHPDGYRKENKFGVIVATVIVSALIMLMFLHWFCQMSLTKKNDKYKLKLIGSVTLNLLPVEAGTFMMGSIDKASNIDETPHKVILTKDYWIGKYEITQEQYKIVMEMNPSIFKRNYPVELVSWTNAQEFCKKLNNMFSTQLPEGYEFRLPTEAEWEYAARGGKKSKGYKYSGSNDIGTVAWYDDNSKYENHPVGTKQPNELGIYDMSGNVNEWCLDSYDEDPNYSVTDPLCATGSDHVARGGDSTFSARWCRVSRRRVGWSNGCSGIGFRVALAPEIVEHRESKTPQSQSVVEEKPQQLKQMTLIPKDDIYELSFGEEVTQDLLIVESGTFTMGSSDKYGRKDEIPHQVTLTKNYWIGKHEVTQEQYELVMGENPSYFKKGGNYPVECVSWNDVQEFCEKLNSMLASQLPDGYEFRLPTEAEWEYAAHGGSKSKGYNYSGSNEIDAVAWWGEKSTIAVGTMQPNELGIYDMTGNVREWCLDYYDAYPSKAVTDPLRTTGLDHVERGGSFCDAKHDCRVSSRARSYGGRFGGNSLLGFRIVLAKKIAENSNYSNKNTAQLQPTEEQSLQSLTLNRKDEKYELSLREGLLLELLPVEAGTFTMGSSDKDAKSDEIPHQVTLTQDYWIGKYEVTQAQYEAVMGENPSRFKKGGNYPAERVSWINAQAFCKELNSKLSTQLPAGYEFRLPTEAEWEYAARGGKKSKGYKYSGSDDIDTVAWYKEIAQEGTHPVGIKQPNELGIYDMSGNVCEWCLDYYGKDPCNAVTDPLRTTGSDRVFRSGSWFYYARYCRVSCRSYFGSSGRDDKLGFRIALAPCG